MATREDRTIRVQSKSRGYARVDDIELRKTASTRLIFRPGLVQNTEKPEASVRGHFLFQKKGFNDEWKDMPTEPLSKLKKGESVKLELHAAETLHLFRELSELYKLYKKDGIPYGDTEYVRANSDLSRLLDLPREDLRRLIKARGDLGHLFSALLDWVLEADDVDRVMTKLVELGPQSLQKLNLAVGVQSLREALSLWQDNLHRGEEEFWQKSLTNQSFVLEYIFSWPCTIIDGKAYVGGKTVTNKGGKLVDFLVQNRITDNSALVEIKTPNTPLLGRRYRQSIFNVSSELSGAILQVLDYKQSLLNEYQTLKGSQPDLFEAFDPKCVVIIGSGQQELSDPEKRRSSDLFRNQLSDVTVVTFDEMFGKLEILIGMLEKVQATSRP